MDFATVDSSQLGAIFDDSDHHNLAESHRQVGIFIRTLCEQHEAVFDADQESSTQTVVVLVALTWAEDVDFLANEALKHAEGGATRKKTTWLEVLTWTEVGSADRVAEQVSTCCARWLVVDRGQSGTA